MNTATRACQNLNIRANLHKIFAYDIPCPRIKFTENDYANA